MPEEEKKEEEKKAEEKKDEEKKEEEKKVEEKKDEEKKEEDKPVVLRVDMHCKACEDRVKKALNGFPGVENVHTDMKGQTVTVKGKVDVRKVFETVKKKSGRRTVLLSPELKEGVKEEKRQEETKKEEPVDSTVTVVLKVKMHCIGCAREVKKSVLKLQGVTNVDVDFPNDQVTVTGTNLDPKKVCDRVKKSGKHCEIVPPPPPKEEKKEEKKEEEKKEEEKKEEEKKEEEKKEEKVEEKKEEKAEEKKEEKESDETKTEVKKYEYAMYRSYPEYVYPPQLFSDENPNACSLM